MYGWPADKVAGWIAYSDTADGPFWLARGDVQAAQICMYLASTKEKPLSIPDIQLNWSPRPTKWLSQKEAVALLDARISASGKRT